MKIGKRHYVPHSIFGTKYAFRTLCGRYQDTVGWTTMAIPARRPRRKAVDDCAHCYKKLPK
jgi:hypothetical protein